MRYLIFLLCFVLSCGFVPIGAAHPFAYIRADAPPHTVAREIPVFLDANLTAEDKLHIDDALRQWNYGLNDYVRFKIVDLDFQMEPSNIRFAEIANGLMILQVSKDYPFIPAQKEPGMWTLAWADVDAARIYLVRDRMKTPDIFPVMMHELGHFLHAQHRGGHNLMYPTYDPIKYQCIDKMTMQQVATYLNLNINHLNYCMDAY